MLALRKLLKVLLVLAELFTDPLPVIFKYLFYCYDAFKMNNEFIFGLAVLFKPIY